VERIVFYLDYRRAENATASYNFFMQSFRISPFSSSIPFLLLLLPPFLLGLFVCLLACFCRQANFNHHEIKNKTKKLKKKTINLIVEKLKFDFLAGFYARVLNGLISQSFHNSCIQ
jgi:hypothetical protein